MGMDIEMKTKEQIQEELSNFYGSVHWYRYSPILFPKVLLTDGAKFIAEEFGAYRLMDMIASHLPAVRKADAYFAVATFNKTPEKYSDFMFDEFKLYVAYDGEYWTIMLPSEY